MWNFGNKKRYRKNSNDFDFLGPKAISEYFHKNQRTSFIHGRQWVQTCLNLHNQIKLHAASWHRGDFAHVNISATLKDFCTCKHLPANTQNILHIWTSPETLWKMFHVGTSLLTLTNFCTWPLKHLKKIFFACVNFFASITLGTKFLEQCWCNAGKIYILFRMCGASLASPALVLVVLIICQGSTRGWTCSWTGFRRTCRTLLCSLALF